MPRSRPPYSAGQLTTDQRSSYMVRSQARCASKPSAVSSEGRGSAGTCAASHARASARNASCSALKVRSMALRISHRAAALAKVARSARRAGMPVVDERLDEEAHDEADDGGFRGRLARRVELVPALGHGHELARVAVDAEVPGQLLRLLGIDDLVVVRIEDEEGRVARRDVGDRARLLQVGAELLGRARCRGAR